MQESNDYEDPQNMMWLLGQFLMIPIAAVVYSVEMLLKTMQGMQQITGQGMEVMVGPNASTNMSAEASGTSLATAKDSSITNQKSDFDRNPNKEDKKLIETNQNFCTPDQKDGKCLILWRYKILFIKREFEHAFPEVEDLIPDDLPDITAWKIAEFVQQLGNCKYPVPTKWVGKRYPDPKKYWRLNCKDKRDHIPTDKDVEAAVTTGEPVFYLFGLPEEDKKFLRVYAQQLASYTRQDPRYEERKIEVLQQISNKLDKVEVRPK